MDQLERQHGNALYATGSAEGRQLLMTTKSICQLALDTWLSFLKMEEPGFTPRRAFVSALNGNGVDSLKHQLEQMALTCRT